MINLLTETQPWEERQIRKRGEALVRSEFSQDAELILNRKLQGAMLGQYTLTAEEQTQVDWFNTMVTQARIAVDKALADNELLQQILAHEQAQRDVADLTLRINGRPEAWLPIQAELQPGTLVQLADGRVGEMLDTDEVFDPEPKTTVDVRIDAETDVLDVDVSSVTPVEYQEAIDPMPQTVQQADEQGNPVTVPNPEYEAAVAALAAAEAIIAGASAVVLNWVEQRA